VYFASLTVCGMSPIMCTYTCIISAPLQCLCLGCMSVGYWTQTCMSFFAVALYSSCSGVDLHSFIVAITSGRLSLPGDGVETRYIVTADAICWHTGIVCGKITVSVQKLMDFEVESVRPRGTPKKTRRAVVKEDRQTRQWNKEDAGDYTNGARQQKVFDNAHKDRELVSWSLTSLFSTNMAISETKIGSE